MAKKRVWVGTGDITTTDGKTTGEVEEVGVEYDVDTFTIETSGALTLWKEIVPGQRSELIVAYAAGSWTKCHVLGKDGEPVGTLTQA